MKLQTENASFDTKEPSKHSFIWITSLILSVSSIAVGIYLVYCSSDFKFDSSFLGSLFSLAGVFIFAATLIYQVFEFRLQIIELRKSVDAQTKSSEALENQKMIMLEQTNDSYLMGIINGFSSYKEFESTKQIIWGINDRLFDDKLVKFLTDAKPANLNKIIDDFVITITNNARLALENHDGVTIFTYQFWGIIKEIERCNINDQKRAFYLSYFINQLSIEEKVPLIFSEILDVGGSPDELYFINHPQMKQLINHITKNPLIFYTTPFAFDYFVEQFKERLATEKQSRWRR